MPRPTDTEYFLDMARHVSSKGTCSRRQVGCVLVDGRKHVLSTGYNGVAAHQPHCIDTPCPGAKCKSGEGLELCEAIHAEQNALLQCSDVFKIEVAYVTASPCVHCIKLLLNTSCRIIVSDENYPHADSKRLWESAGRSWVKA